MPDPIIHPIVMSGGSGMRLWPLSRELYPKQFHKLLGAPQSLLQETVLRFAGQPNFASPVVVSNEAHRFVLGAQLQETGVKPAAIILEPSARGTAPAIAAATLLPHIGDEDLLLAMPTDHLVGDAGQFRKDVLDALPAARSGKIVVFGVPPTRPETGYGYIHAGEPLGSGSGVRRLLGFVEKPPPAEATKLCASGKHVWNMGVFLFKKSALLRELDRLAPEVLAHTAKAVGTGTTDQDFFRLDASAFSNSPSISIDVAVMEKTDRGAVQFVSFAWSDLGSWSSLWETTRPPDGAFDGAMTVGDVEALDVRNSYIRSDAGLVVAIGVTDLIVVSSGDATLVASMDRARDVGKMVEKLRSQRRREARNHILVHRPWGTFQTLAEGPGYQVKILSLYPKASISLQFHRHRAEQWSVLEGRAEVKLDGTTTQLGPHDSIHVPLGAVHKLHNPGDTILKVIEVQSGDYLGEDDIMRLD